MLKARVLLLLVAVMFIMVGCSQYSCYWGACKSLGDEQTAAVTVAQNSESQPEELTASLRRVADYSAELYENSKFLGGAYANSTYHTLLMRLVGDSEAAAWKAETGTVTDEWKRQALSGLAGALGKLQKASMGQK